MDEIEPPEELQRRLLAASENTPVYRSFLLSFIQASVLAKQRPLEVPTPSYPLGPDLTPSYQEFVSFVGWLAAVEHPEPFPLPSDTLAALLTCPQKAIDLFIGVATDEGLLKYVSQVNQQTPGDEAQYRLKNIEAFPKLKAWLHI